MHSSAMIRRPLLTLAFVLMGCVELGVIKSSPLTVGRKAASVREQRYLHFNHWRAGVMMLYFVSLPATPGLFGFLVEVWYVPSKRKLCLEVFRGKHVSKGW